MLCRCITQIIDVNYQFNCIGIFVVATILTASKDDLLSKLLLLFIVTSVFLFPICMGQKNPFL